MKRAVPNWNALKFSKTEGTEVATAAKAEDTEEEGGGGGGLNDADKLYVISIFRRMMASANPRPRQQHLLRHHRRSLLRDHTLLSR